MNDIVKMIEDLGGSKLFSLKYNIPYRTVQDWKLKNRVPPAWLVDLLASRAPSMPGVVLSDCPDLEIMVRDYRKYYSLLSHTGAIKERDIYLEKVMILRNSIFHALYNLFPEE